jgi:hybrid cluster-associated redox disulfide protein
MVGFLPAAQDTVDEVMRKWPQTIHVFMRHRMACIGCAFAVFHTVEISAAEHDIGLARLLRELRVAAAFGERAGSAEARSAARKVPDPIPGRPLRDL